MGEREDRLAEHERDMLWEKISDLEHRGWRALCDGSAARFYKDLMTDDGLMVLADGVVMDREQVREALDDADSWDNFEMRDEKLLTPGPDVATLVYRGTGHRGDGSNFVAMMSSTYVRDTSRDVPWALALYTQTPITD